MAIVKRDDAMAKLEKLIKKFQTIPLPVDIDIEDFIKYAKNFGFKYDRIRGSHYIFIHDKLLVPFPVPTVNGKKVKNVYLRELNRLIKNVEE